MNITTPMQYSSNKLIPFLVKFVSENFFHTLLPKIHIFAARNISA